MTVSHSLWSENGRKLYSFWGTETGNLTRVAARLAQENRGFFLVAGPFSGALRCLFPCAVLEGTLHPKP